MKQKLTELKEKDKSTTVAGDSQFSQNRTSKKKNQQKQRP